MRRSRATTCWLVAAGLAAGCGGGAEQTAEPVAAEQLRPKRAEAAIEAKSDSGVTGQATFTEEDGRVTLHIEIRNAPPGEHAFHLHEIGDCSAPDGTSAGGHWNPTTAAHGKWGVSPFHLGDVGNILVGEDGTGSYHLVSDVWSLGSGQDNDVVGRAVIVHAGADDFTSQPTGAAGGRIGCGVIALVEAG